MSNREIKFRAWDVTLGKSIDGGNPITQQGKLLTVTRSLTYEGVHSREVALMQYTGLKDKNGVEIYEGDVIFIGGFEDRGDGNYDDVLMVVSFEDGSFVCKDEAGGYCEYLKEYEGECEVISNIHQNPELLK